MKKNIPQSILRKYKELYYAMKTNSLGNMMIKTPIDKPSLITSIANLWVTKKLIEQGVAELIENNVKAQYSYETIAYSCAYTSMLRHKTNVDESQDCNIGIMVSYVLGHELNFDRRNPSKVFGICAEALYYLFDWAASKEGFVFWSKTYEAIRDSAREHTHKYGGNTLITPIDRELQPNNDNFYNGLIISFLDDILNDFDVIVKYYENKHTSISIEEI